MKKKACKEEMQIKLETYNDCNCNLKSVIANKHNSAHIRVQWNFTFSYGNVDRTMTSFTSKFLNVQSQTKSIPAFTSFMGLLF